MVTRLCLLFAAGVLIDLLATVYTKSVADRRVWSATVLSGLLTLISFSVFLFIIKSLDVILDIMVFSAGNTAGTYIGMVRYKWEQKISY